MYIDDDYSLWEKMTWLNDNCRDSCRVVADYSQENNDMSGVLVAFENPDDATCFKLKFL